MSPYQPPRPWIASYAEGVPDDLAPVSGSLIDIVAASARDYPDAPALQFFGRETTYAQLQDAIDRAAEGLRDLGVRAGDPVAIVLPNCPQHIVAFYAVLRLGAVVVEHNPLYTPRGSASSSRTTARSTRSSGTRSYRRCRSSRPISR